MQCPLINIPFFSFPIFFSNPFGNHFFSPSSYSDLFFWWTTRSVSQILLCWLNIKGCNVHALISIPLSSLNPSNNHFSSLSCSSLFFRWTTQIKSVQRHQGSWPIHKFACSRKEWSLQTNKVGTFWKKKLKKKKIGTIIN